MVKLYSQNLEEQFIAEYFGAFIGTLLSIGENDGVTLSNSRALIEKGWSAILVEPSNVAFKSLFTKYGNDNKNIWCFNVAISDFIGEADFYESGKHLGDADTGLLSTLYNGLISKWKGTEFEKKKCLVWDYKELQRQAKNTGRNYTYDFITIDAEGNDVTILKQIDLTPTKLLCIEHNSVPKVKQEIIEYCAKYGMTKVIYENAENILIAR